MSCKELIEALRKGADERIRLLWKNAETEAEGIKAVFAEKIEQVRTEAGRNQITLAEDKVAQAVSDGNYRARAMILSAEKELTDRLYAVAGSSLHTLRNEAYAVMFATMVQELPSAAWDDVRVNPKDITLAKQYFHGAEISGDPHIAGGMDVTTQDGAIRVINTFEKRLERAWSDMLPTLIREVYQKIDATHPVMEDYDQSADKASAAF